MAEPLVSVVLTSYRRMDHLRRTLDSTRACLTYSNLEWILCDDGSPADVQAEMRKLPFDIFVFGSKNEGLGVSLNRGLRLARGEYVLYLQDDWLCTRRGPFVEEAIEALRAFPRLGIVKLTDAPALYARERTVETPSGIKVRIPVLDEPGSYRGIYTYSQNPHVKHRSFHEKLGYFVEGAKGVGTEDEFCRRFNANGTFEVGTVQGHEGQFVHIGDDLSYFKGKGRWRQNWRHRLSRSPITRIPLRAFDALPESVRWALRGKGPRGRKRS